MGDVVVDCVECGGKVDRIQVVSSRELVLQVIDETTISKTIGSLYESNGQRLVARDSFEGGQFSAVDGINILGRKEFINLNVGENIVVANLSTVMFNNFY